MSLIADISYMEVLKQRCEDNQPYIAQRISFSTSQICVLIKFIILFQLSLAVLGLGWRFEGGGLEFKPIIYPQYQ